MASFEVTPGDLHGLAGQLSSLLGELSGAAGTLNAGAAGAAQNGQLEHSIGAFLSDWSSGLGHLREQLAEVSQRLEAAATAYDGTESEIATHFGG
jgi:uncharacterized protein YukE